MNPDQYTTPVDYIPSTIFPLTYNIQNINISAIENNYDELTDAHPIIFNLDTPIPVNIPVIMNDNITIEFPTDEDDEETIVPLVSIVPKMIFIVPHRDREKQRDNFVRRMAYILEDIPIDDYAIFFVNQCDNRCFNRGAIKNIGFMAMKEKYPDDYKTISFVFNDVDTTPVEKNTFDYITVPGKIKHFYGFNYALGGIFSVTGQDFERMNGFINLWTWGYEDNYLQTAADRHNIVVSRDVFYKINDKRIEYLADVPFRTVNKGEFDLYISGSREGINTISNLVYDLDIDLGYVNVREFDTGHVENILQRLEYDLRNGPIPFTPPKQPVKRGNAKMKMLF